MNEQKKQEEITLPVHYLITCILYINSSLKIQFIAKQSSDMHHPL